MGGEESHGPLLYILTSQVILREKEICMAKSKTLREHLKEIRAIPSERRSEQSQINGAKSKGRPKKEKKPKE